jgi:excisionase family DNA binding protein
VVITLPDSTWAATIPLDRIPGALTQLAALQAALAARLVVVTTPCRPVASELVDAPEMARRLKVHESWVRTEQRAARIPFIQVGRYVRFRPADVEAAIAARTS